MAVSSWRSRKDVMCETGALARGVVKRWRERGTRNELLGLGVWEVVRCIHRAFMRSRRVRGVVVEARRRNGRPRRDRLEIGLLKERLESRFMLSILHLDSIGTKESL